MFVDIALECFDKTRKGKALMPLQSVQNFQVLVNACPRSGATSSRKDPSRSKSLSPTNVRRSVVCSPTKEPTIVAMSSDVSRSVGQTTKMTPYGYVNSRGNGVSIRQMKNTPRATPTVVTGTTVNANQRQTANSPNKESSAKSRAAGENTVNTTKSSGENVGKAQNDQTNKIAANGSSAAGLPSNRVSGPNTNSQISKTMGTQQSKANSSTAKEQISDTNPKVKSSSSTARATGNAKQSVEKIRTPSRKVPLRKETNASYKVIVKETKLPAETQIVIVDNKSKTEITEEPRKPTKTPVNPPESVERYPSMKEGSPKPSHDGSRSQEKQIESDNQSVRSKWASDLGNEDNNSSKQTGVTSEKRKSPNPTERTKSKTPDISKAGVQRKSAKLTDLKDVETTGIIKSDMDRTYESKKINVYYTGHGTATGVLNSESITPVDSTQPGAMKYATVFPISPYTEPVAQFKMTHRPKKAKPKTTDDKSFRGS